MQAQETAAVMLDRMQLDEMERLESFRPGSKRQLVDLFVEGARGYFKTAHEALAQEDFRRLRTAAHSIKGAGAGMGARQLAAIALRMEHCAASGALPECTALLPVLEAEFERTIGYLEDWLRNPLPAPPED